MKNLTLIQLLLAVLFIPTNGYAADEPEWKKRTSKNICYLPETATSSPWEADSKKESAKNP